jgi:hypothetical protein
MTRLEKIEREIKALGPQDLARFRAWFVDYEAANWDAKIEVDATAGRLDTLADRAFAAHRSGHTRAI